MRKIEGVGKHQAAFRIGVDDFYGLTITGFDDISGLGCRSRGHVLGKYKNGRDLVFRAESGGEQSGADHGRRSSHVVLHVLHPRTGLQRDPAGVEGHALSNQGNVLRSLGACFGRVFYNHNT